MGRTRIVVPLSKKLSPEERSNIETLSCDLLAMDVRMFLETHSSNNVLVFEYDTDTHKRNAGRKRKAIPSESPLCKMSQEELDCWLLSNPIELIQEELKIGRATAFRRRAEANERISYAIVSFDDD